MISFEPTDEEKAIRDEVRKLAEKELRARARECEKAHDVPDALRRTYHELGLAVLDLPETCGGAGLGAVTRAIVEEELAFGDGGLACGLGASLFASYALLELGDEAQRQALIPRLSDPAAPARRGTLAIAEGDLGAELLDRLQTRAERAREGGYAIAGTKLFVPDAHAAELFVVLARGEGGPESTGALKGFVVERGAAGLTVGREDDRQGLNAVRSFAVELAGVRVADGAALAGGDAPEAALRRLLARIWIVTAARQVGIARACLEYAAYYAQERSAFGQKIGQFQSIAFKIADMAMDVDSARWLTWRAAWELDKGRDTAARSAALACVHANDAACRAGIDAVQVLGGAGFVEDYPVEKWYRDARTLAAAGGVDTLRNHFLAESAYGPLGDGGGAGPDPSSAFAAFGQAFGA